MVGRTDVDDAIGDQRRPGRAPTAAAGAVDLRPPDVLHVGDDATLDALGALNAGMQAAWINRSDHLWPHEMEPQVTLTTLTELCELFK